MVQTIHYLQVITLIFLNSILQLKGSTESYTYTGSAITFNEAPVSGMDFYGFYLVN